MAKYARFTADYGRRIKSTVDMFQPKGVPAAAPSRADILSGYSSPVEIAEDWEEDENGLWKCKAKRLFRTDGTYQAREGGPEIDLWDPCGTGKPSPAAGDKVFAVWRGVWELVSSAGGGQIVIAKLDANLTDPETSVKATTITQESIDVYCQLVNLNFFIWKTALVTCALVDGVWEVIDFPKQCVAQLSSDLTLANKNTGVQARVGWTENSTPPVIQVFGSGLTVTATGGITANTFVVCSLLPSFNINTPSYSRYAWQVTGEYCTV